MFSADDPFVDFLRSRRDQAVYLKPHPGNSGDDLIWMGTEALLEQLGLRRVLDPRKAGIILWPGGNPTMWSGNLEEWKYCWDHWPQAEFVVAPATFQGSELPWQQMLTTTTARIGALFARDPESLENLRRAGLPPSVQIGLSHDPAFHLKDGPWIAALREAGTSEYILAAFRTDHESALRLPGAHRWCGVWPFSAMWAGRRRRFASNFRQERLDTVRRHAGSTLPVREEDASALSFQSYVECISRAAQVHTDRLHCMILAAMLDKPVFAYPTAYAKLETVYEHSLQPWAKVQFVGKT